MTPFIFREPVLIRPAPSNIGDTIATNMDLLKEGEKAPQICLPDQDGNEKCIPSRDGRWTVLYFYPKDNTPGCTQEAMDFSARSREFDRSGADIIGISPDNCSSHRSFIDGKGLKLTLLSDVGHGALDSYGVWKAKKMYGKEFMGVERSTFLIDPSGAIRKAWRKVKVEGHADEVLAELRSVA